MKTHIYLIACICVLSARCGVEGDHFAGTWEMPETHQLLTIERNEPYLYEYTVSGIPEIAGKYMVTAGGGLYPTNGLEGGMGYDEDNDRLIVTMPALAINSVAFDRLTQSIYITPGETVTGTSSEADAPCMADYDEPITAYEGQWFANRGKDAEYFPPLLDISSKGGDSIRWHECRWMALDYSDYKTTPYKWIAFQNDNGTLFRRSGDTMYEITLQGDSVLQLALSPRNDKTYRVAFSH